MIETEEQGQAEATILCKSCGLCCTGHLFAWTKLRSAELKPAQTVGLTVMGSDPNQRGFNQPCPLWEGQCTIYTSPQYPHYCRVYKCKLLKKVIDDTIQLPEALTVVQQAKEMIRELESLLPVSSNKNFRERFVAHIENGNPNRDFQTKAINLLRFYKDYFGVKDVIDNLDEV